MLPFDSSFINSEQTAQDDMSLEEWMKKRSFQLTIGSKKLRFE